MLKHGNHQNFYLKIRKDNKLRFVLLAKALDESRVPFARFSDLRV